MSPEQKLLLGLTGLMTAASLGFASNPNENLSKTESLATRTATPWPVFTSTPKPKPIIIPTSTPKPRVVPIATSTPRPREKAIATPTRIAIRPTKTPIRSEIAPVRVILPTTTPIPNFEYQKIKPEPLGSRLNERGNLDLDYAFRFGAVAAGASAIALLIGCSLAKAALRD